MTPISARSATAEQVRDGLHAAAETGPFFRLAASTVQLALAARLPAQVVLPVLPAASR